MRACADMQSLEARQVASELKFNFDNNLDKEMFLICVFLF